MSGFSLELAAFVAGIFMFLAPCTLPLVPALLSSLVPGGNTRRHEYARELMQKTLLFSCGFSTVFISFGVLTGFFGSALISYRVILSQIGGIFVILFGLSLLNLIQIPFLRGSAGKIGKVTLSKERTSTALILGAIFALGWTPCAGPILASILLLATQAGSGLQGGVLLASFSLGVAVPFIFVGALYAHTMSVFNLYERYRTFISFMSGIFLIIGVFVLFNQTFLMTTWGFTLYSYFGYVPMCLYF